MIEMSRDHYYFLAINIFIDYHMRLWISRRNNTRLNTASRLAAWSSVSVHLIIKDFHARNVLQDITGSNQDHTEDIARLVNATAMRLHAM